MTPDDQRRAKFLREFSEWLHSEDAPDECYVKSAMAAWLAAAERYASEEDRRDAERYRWLANQGCMAIKDREAHGEIYESCYLDLCPRDLDAAIDAALHGESANPSRKFGGLD